MIERKQVNKGQQLLITIGILLALISGSLLIHRWWKSQQFNTKIARLEQQLAQEKQKWQKASEQYHLQKNWVSLTNPLANNPQVKQVFHCFLQNFADRYAKSKGIDNSHLPLFFGGFSQKVLAKGEQQGRMGSCHLDKENQLVVITLNQLYLLNKLGHERYLPVYPQENITYLAIDFANMTETLAHELSHYLQFVKHGKSSCESSGKKDANNKFLFPELVSEHAQLTREIKAMIVNSVEYEKFREWWNNPKN